jgi:putative membrane protein
MRFGVIFAALLGLALGAWLVVSLGFRSVVSAMLAVGWGGFILLCMCGAALFVVLGTAWFVLVPRQEEPRLANFVFGRAVRECASELLPVSQVGGIIIGARAVKLRGLSGSLAFASSIVDVTVEMVAQIVFVLAGLGVLLAFVPGASTNEPLVRSVILGVVAAAIAAVLFLLLQRSGLDKIIPWSRRHFPKGGDWLDKVNRSLSEIHASPTGLAISFAIHVSGWLGTALWAWIALYLIGRPISFPFVFAIEAIVSAVRSAAIVVPGAIGVQEASYALLGPLFGLAAPAAIALSLLKRARDVAIGVPVLLALQFTESGRALTRHGNSVRLSGRKRP